VKRALVAICAVLLLGGAGAAPRTRRPSAKPVTPAMIDAEALWKAAVAETDAGRKRAAWRAAGRAFGVVADDATAPEGERADATYAAMLAWNSAVELELQSTESTESTEPTELTADEAELVRAIDRYLALTRGRVADEVVEAMYMRARLLRRHHRYAEAAPTFAAIIADHPRHELAEYAAELLLDDLNREQRYDELVALAEQLRATPAMMRGRGELERRLEAIHVAALRRRAERIEKQAHDTRRPELFVEGARLYLAIQGELAAGLSPAGMRIDHGELLYNAMVMFQEAGEADLAVATGTRLLTEYPASPHAARTRARIATLEAGRARYAEALDMLDAYVRSEMQEARPRRSKDVAQAASDAVYYALALGRPARAAVIIDRVATELGPDDRLRAEVGLAWGLVRSGKRGEVAARAKTAVALAIGARSSRELASLGGALAAAACPVELVDELCPKRRTKALVTTATKLLARVRPDPDAPWLAPYAARVTLDLALEAGGGTAAVEAGYLALLDPPTPEAAAAAARLATLAHRAKRTDDALRYYRLCLAAEHALSDGRWIDLCHRGLATLGAPDADLVPELRTRAGAGTMEMTVAGP
jgi:hypothetical protein